MLRLDEEAVKVHAASSLDRPRRREAAGGHGRIIATIPARTPSLLLFFGVSGRCASAGAGATATTLFRGRIEEFNFAGSRTG